MKCYRELWTKSTKPEGIEKLGKLIEENKIDKRKNKYRCNRNNKGHRNINISV